MIIQLLMIGASIVLMMVVEYIQDKKQKKRNK